MGMMACVPAKVVLTIEENISSRLRPPLYFPVVILTVSNSVFLSIPGFQSSRRRALDGTRTLAAGTARLEGPCVMGIYGHKRPIHCSCRLGPSFCRSM